MGTSGAVNHRTYIHEFFHNIEAAYDSRYQFVRHVYQQNYRQFWPAWYQGEGELVYYRSAFKQIILPAGIDPLMFRMAESGD